MIYRQVIFFNYYVVHKIKMHLILLTLLRHIETIRYNTTSNIPIDMPGCDDGYNIARQYFLYIHLINNH